MFLPESDLWPWWLKVVARPGDAALRLVLADVLDERGVGGAALRRPRGWWEWTAKGSAGWFPESRATTRRPFVLLGECPRPPLTRCPHCAVVAGLYCYAGGRAKKPRWRCVLCRRRVPVAAAAWLTWDACGSIE